MKKIICLFSALLLFVALAIPSFAEEVSTVSSEDVWIVPAGWSYSESKQINIINGTINGIEFGKFQLGRFFNGETVVNRADSITVSKSDTYYNFSPSDELRITFDPAYNSISELKAWLNANGYLYEERCDGTSCPATDLNYDNVCDDCGLTFAIPRDYSPEDWPAELPSPPSVYDSYTVLTENGITYLFMVDGEEPKITISDPDLNNKRTLTFSMEGEHPSVNIQRYQLIDGGWAYSSVNSLRSFKFDDSLVIHYTTVVIYDSTGTPFFPPVPSPGLEAVITPEALGAELTKVPKTMILLASLAVGLLACLAVLKIFGKVLYPFRP